MTRTRRRGLAAILFAATLLGLGTTVGLLWVSSVSGVLLESLVVLSIVLAFGITGLVLAIRVPGNRIGWIYLVSSVLGGIWITSLMYTNLALAESWPGPAYSAVTAQAIYMPWILTMVALPMLLFPTGRPPERWRWLLPVVVFTIGLTPVGTLLDDRQLGEWEGLVSPFAIEGLQGVLGPGRMVAVGLILASILGSVAALVSRFRKARGVERQQLKWLAFSASVAGAGLAFIYAVQEFGVPDWLSVVQFVPLLGVLGIPVATGMAVAKYRLYDIDRLISRTIVYGLVVAVLVGVYAGSVSLIGTLLPGESSAAVALSTLAVAALFNPLRRRVRRGIDRRFFRAPYDAQAVVEELSVRLNGEVDLAAVEEELLAVVADTVQPAGAGVWIRDRS